MLKKLATIGLCALFLLTAAQFGFGQTVTATLTGTVTDSSGSAVPAAAVTLTNELSGDVRRTTSGATGYFALPAVPAGTYKLTVENPGFRGSETRGILKLEFYFRPCSL